MTTKALYDPAKTGSKLMALQSAELLANIRVEPPAFQCGLFLFFATSGLPGLLAILKSSCHMAPLADPGGMPRRH